MICDWILAKMPWLVENIGGMSLAGQITLAFGAVFAFVLAYSALQKAVNGERPRRKPARKKETRFNWLERWQRKRYDREDYLEWMDYDIWKAEEEEWNRYRTRRGLDKWRSTDIAMDMKASIDLLKKTKKTKCRTAGRVQY